MTDLAQTNVMALRAELMNHVRQIVQTEGWTQSQAAEHLGVAQSRVSDLLNGKFEKFSLDRRLAEKLPSWVALEIPIQSFLIFLVPHR